MGRDESLIGIVDDDVSFREALSGLVKSLGFCVLAFASADEFLEYCPVRDPACLIVDIQMPGMDGLELRDRLKGTDRRIPIIFITSFQQDCLVKRALGGGATGLLYKPVKIEELVALIRQALATA